MVWFTHTHTLITRRDANIDGWLIFLDASIFRYRLYQYSSLHLRVITNAPPPLPSQKRNIWPISVKFRYNCVVSFCRYVLRVDARWLFCVLLLFFARCDFPVYIRRYGLAYSMAMTNALRICFWFICQFRHAFPQSVSYYLIRCIDREVCVCLIFKLVSLPSTPIAQKVNVLCSGNGLCLSHPLCLYGCMCFVCWIRNATNMQQMPNTLTEKKQSQHTNWNICLFFTNNRHHNKHNQRCFLFFSFSINMQYSVKICFIHENRSHVFYTNSSKRT